MRRRLMITAAAASLAALLVVPLAGSSGERARFRASFVAPTHTPTAGKPWRYAIYIRSLSGRPVTAVAKQFVMLGTRKIDTVGFNKFRGAYRHTYYWPSVDRGKALAFQVNLQGPGGTKILKYAVRVR